MRNPTKDAVEGLTAQSWAACGYCGTWAAAVVSCSFAGYIQHLLSRRECLSPTHPLLTQSQWAALHKGYLFLHQLSSMSRKRPPIHPLPAQEHHLLPASSIPSQLSATWWTAQTTKQQKNRHFLGAGLAPAVASNGAHRNALQHVCDTQWPPLQMRSRASWSNRLQASSHVLRSLQMPDKGIDSVNTTDTHEKMHHQPFSLVSFVSRDHWKGFYTGSIRMADKSTWNLQKTWKLVHKCTVLTGNKYTIG